MEGHGATATRGSSSGLRARKKQQTFEALRDAAVRRFAAYGYDDTTIAEIADDANVSLRTFFRYFRCKEALLFRTDDEASDAMRSALTTRPADEPLLVSIREIFAGTWQQNRQEDDERRRLRDELIETHPAVARYAYEFMTRFETELASFAADRLGCSHHDPQPQVFAQLCLMLYGRTMFGRSVGADAVAHLDGLLAALSELVRQADDRQSAR